MTEDAPEDAIICKNCGRPIALEPKTPDMEAYWYHIWSAIQPCNFFVVGQFAEPANV